MFIMQVLQGKNNLSGIKFCSDLCKNYCYYESLCFLLSKPNNSPPGQYSRAKNSFFAF